MAKTAWRAEFSAAVTTTLSDSRLWLIVLPSLVLCGLALALVKTWLASVISIAITLIDAHLINRIDTLPRPDGKQLATSIYQAILLPAIVGILIISNSGLLARVWFLPWHWFHSSDAVPPCSYILSGAAFDWLGIFVVAGITALLMKERAVFAVIVGLTVYVPLDLTESFSGDTIQKATALLARSCQMETPSDAEVEGFGIGAVTAVLTRALIAIFVAKVVSTWLSRKNAQARFG